MNKSFPSHSPPFVESVLPHPFIVTQYDKIRTPVMQDKYSLHNIVLISKLFIIEAELLNKIGRHLLHLIIRKGLANPGPTIMI